MPTNTNTPAPHRRELLITRVANGVIIQPAALGQQIDPETGKPFPPNTPADIVVCQSPMDLSSAMMNWFSGGMRLDGAVNFGADAVEPIGGRLMADTMENVPTRPYEPSAGII